jgi:hypothetical protein
VCGAVVAVGTYELSLFLHIATAVVGFGVLVAVYLMVDKPGL